MGGSAPSPDKNIGIAAMKSAETGQEMLGWMKGQAEITNDWAAQDRGRYQDKFIPMQDAFIAEAEGYDTPQRRQAEADKAGADVALAGRVADGSRLRSAMAMGINPESGRYQSATAKAGTDLALAGAGAGNIARRGVEETGRSLRASAINLGQGLGVNPGTSMGISNQAGQAGFGGAMQGYQQQGNLLNTDYQNQMQAWQANQGALGSLGGAFGSIAGLLMPSSKEIKHDKAPIKDGASLKAVENMPIEKWTYNDGAGDGGRHVGPYAEDFARETGKGNGKSIPVIDAIGVTMGAVKDLSAQVKRLSARMPPMGVEGMRMAA